MERRTLVVVQIILRPNGMDRVRRGYVLIYILFAVAAVAAMAALVVPTVATTSDQARIAAAAATLQTLEASVDSFATHVTVFPGTLSELTTQITTANKNSCQAAMVTANVTGWTTWGPFLKTMFADPGGIYTPIGKIQNTVPTRVLGKNDVYVHIAGVDTADASALDRYIDGASGTLGDTVTTIPATPAHDTVTVQFRIVKGSALPAGVC
jgi:Tfp pilus assembly protein PilE